MCVCVCKCSMKQTYTVCIVGNLIKKNQKKPLLLLLLLFVAWTLCDEVWWMKRCDLMLLCYLGVVSVFHYWGKTLFSSSSLCLKKNIRVVIFQLKFSRSSEMITLNIKAKLLQNHFKQRKFIVRSPEPNADTVRGSRESQAQQAAASSSLSFGENDFKKWKYMTDRKLLKKV